MESIIVTWTRREDECGCTYVECIKYESVEAFSVEVQHAIERYIDSLTSYEYHHKNWHHSFGNLQRKSAVRKMRKDIMAEEIENLSRRPPTAPSWHATVGTFAFQCNWFLKKDKDGNRSPDMPKIYKLQDWFDLNCKKA